MNPLISKSDFPDYVQFSTNIEDRLVNPHIKDAQIYDLEQRLSVELYNDLIALPAEVPTPTDPKAELRAFLNDYVKRYLVLYAYIRFISEHGTNITQFGITQLGDPAGTFQVATEERRAVFLKNKRSDMDIAMTRMFNRLVAVNYTFDGVTYVKENLVQKKSLPISAIRRKNISDAPFNNQVGYGIYEGTIRGSE